MKKIVCILLTAILLCASLSISVSAANETPKAAYKVNWSELSYYCYWYNKNDNDMSNHFNVSTTENTFTSTAKSGCERRSYFSQQMFAITSETKYEYVFQAKNNRDCGYCGVVFAFANNLPYFIYGSFNNISDDPNNGKSDIRVQKGLNYHDVNNCDTGYSRSYITVAVDSGGYGTFKVVIDGLKASVFGLTDAASGSYSQVGDSITLPSGAQVAVGVFNREGSGSSERTVTIKNAVIYAMNDAAANNLSSMSDGSYELLSYIAKTEAEYPADNYTESSYSHLKVALREAKTAIERGNYSDSDIIELKAAIEEAIGNLVQEDTDFAQLEETLLQLEKLKESEYTITSFKMLTAAMESARLLMEDSGALQSEVNEAIKLLKTRYEALVLAEGVDTPTSPEIDFGDVETETQKATDAPAPTSDYTDDTSYGSDSGTGSGTADAGNGSAEKGCKSAIAYSVLAAVAIVGAALVLKKKD